MNARIEIKNASVSYFLHTAGKSKKTAERGAVGAQVLIRRRYLEIPALRNISLTLESGDRIGLIGLNGSGKSTLLKLCAGALAVQSGTISVQGKVSPQFSLAAGISRELTGRLNAELKCLYMGIPQRTIADRVEEVKELSGLGGYFELPIHTYSAGMRSRLVMSLMRLMRGDILVMDEWINAADPTINHTVSQLQSELIASSSILVMASHSRPILEDWVDKIIWLDQGEIKKFGPASEVYDAYDIWMEGREAISR